MKWRPRKRRLTKAEMYTRAVSHTIGWRLGRAFPSVFPFVFMPGFPKSGTTWAAQLVSDYLELPFPQGSLLPISCQAVVQGHQVCTKDLKYAIYTMRDGRDVMTSLYFFLARELPAGEHPRLTRRQRTMFPGLINRDDSLTNMPGFIRAQLKHPFGARVNWADHVRHALRVPHIPKLRYEDLVSERAAETLAATIAQVTGLDPDQERAQSTLDKYAFRKQSGRRAGSEKRSSFLRKGRSGDWVNHFTHEAAEVFAKGCGEVLIEAGYESDHAWVSRVGESG